MDGDLLGEVSRDIAMPTLFRISPWKLEFQMNTGGLLHGILDLVNRFTCVLPRAVKYSQGSGRRPLQVCTLSSGY